MTTAFFDSSALVKLLVEEDGSELAARLWDDADSILASRLAFPEVVAAVEAARRGRRLTTGGAQDARESWDRFWGDVEVIELTERVAASAADLAGQHALRGADAVHLASALTMAMHPPVLVAWDGRLRAAATDAGLAVAPPTDLPRVELEHE